ncbi:GntR family transcriptional regulator [Muricoccus radiodurans]|uniref:GntR family transcriptional regulator n=1 Tax=Muricoccus radiodurans TaxID=2231721 RepID=UPI003CFA7AD2
MLPLPLIGLDLTEFTPTRSFPDAVAAALREGILTGRLPAGTQLKQDHLARHFGTSRAPVREALQVLTGEGLLIVNRHRGITVAPADPNDLQEIAELRTMLEAHALRLSIPNLTASDMDEAAALLDEADTAPCDPIGQSDLHWRFHRTLMRRAERPRVLAQVESLHIAVSRYLLPAWTAAGLSIGWVASHRKLLTLARRGRRDEAAELNAHQVEEARARVATWLAEQETP